MISKENVRMIISIIGAVISFLLIVGGGLLSAHSKAGLALIIIGIFGLVAVLVGSLSIFTHRFKQHDPHYEEF
jgi:predicted membrane channel-forming protein YqfA (hemolysin III family)